MKKFLVLAILVVLGITNVNAQKANFGVKGGLNFATVSGDNIEGVSTVSAFNFGLMSEIPIFEKFSFQPELMFSGQGYSVGDDLVALNYINVPLVGKYYLTKGLSVEAGPQLGFLISDKNTDSFKSFDFGVNFGLGYKLENGINFGARYNLGLTNIVDSDNYSGENKHGVIQVSVGYFFF